MAIQADLAGLDMLSRRLGMCGIDVDELRRELAALIQTTQWTGGAADRFRQTWESEVRPALELLGQELAVAAQEVERRRAAIDHAAN